MFSYILQGFVDFKESDGFKVLLNVTAPSIEEAYAVTADVTESKGRLLIQVVSFKDSDHETHDILNS